MLKQILLLSISIFWIGCGGTKNVPSYIKNPPSSRIYYYGSGSSTESRDDAEKSARVNLAKNIWVKIEAESIRRTTQDSEEFYQEAKERASQVALRDSRIVDYRRVENTHCVLARVERAEVAREIKRLLDLICEPYRMAKRLEGQGKVLDALQKYLDARRRARMVLPVLEDEKMDLDGDGKEELVMHHLHASISQLLNNIRLCAVSGNGQIAEFEGQLEEPLVVAAYLAPPGRSLSEGIPVPGLRINFRYKKGRGRMAEAGSTLSHTSSTIQIDTDRNGRATCQIKKVQSLSAENIVEVSVDVKVIRNILMSMPDALDKEYPLTPLDKAVFFKYQSYFKPDASNEADGQFSQSVGPTLLINGSEKHGTFKHNEKVTLSVRVQKRCSVHLFHISDLGKIKFIEAKRLDEPEKYRNWEVKRYGGGGWEFSIRGITLTKRGKIEMEAFIAIQSPTTVSVLSGYIPSRKTKVNVENLNSKHEIIKHFDAEVGKGRWRVGQISYEIH